MIAAAIRAMGEADHKAIVDRFWSKVDKTDGCWLWTGETNGNGYGLFRVEGKQSIVAHRLAYELMVGPVPSGLVLDHLCRTRNCVRADGHIEPVTNRTNVLRGVGVTANNHKKEICSRGHALVGDGVIVQSGGLRAGRRFCRVCQLNFGAKYRNARRARESANRIDLAAGLAAKREGGQR